MRDSRHSTVKAPRLSRALFAAIAASLACAPVAAEDKWQADIDVKKSAPAKPVAPPPVVPAAPVAKHTKPNNNTTVIERGGPGAGGTTGSQVKLVALLTDDGQQIDQGLVWRVFQAAAEPTGKSKLVLENREAAPSLKLPPGDYTINASFGRANLTRKVTVKAGNGATEQFVLNAGGLRINAFVAGKPAAQGVVTYTISSDDRDQFANRTAVMTGAKPGLIIRLNAGIYRITSTYGDANARVEADVTVEAGKLTEANVAHTAAKATFKLVTRAGGEALPDTHWAIQSADGGTVVKESVGALPSHFLAPGEYVIVAKSGGRVYQRKFTAKDGETANVEVIVEGQAAEGQTVSGQTQPADALDLSPSLEIKNP